MYINRFKELLVGEESVAFTSGFCLKFLGYETSWDSVHGNKNIMALLKIQAGSTLSWILHFNHFGGTVQKGDLIRKFNVILIKVTSINFSRMQISSDSRWTQRYIIKCTKNPTVKSIYMLTSAVPDFK